jgi:hypothetical protein
VQEPPLEQQLAVFFFAKGQELHAVNAKDRTMAVRRAMIFMDGRWRG